MLDFQVRDLLPNRESVSQISLQFGEEVPRMMSMTGDILPQVAIQVCKWTTTR